MKWIYRYLEVAKLVSSWSKDPSTKVGAVVFELETHRIVSLGFNGPPHGLKDTEYLRDRDLKLAVTIHAEENALLFAGRLFRPCILVSTHPPCSKCAAKIIQAGVGQVCAYYDSFRNYEKRWAEDIALAQGMMAEAGVLYTLEKVVT